jgi:hypothetical protein
MGRKNSSTRNRVGDRRPQSSKRSRAMTPELDLMVRFSMSRDRDREGMGR